MKFQNYLNLKPANVLKVAGLALAAIVLIAFAVRLIGFSEGPFIPKYSMSGSMLKEAQSYDSGGMAYGAGEMDYGKEEAGAMLSTRNIALQKTRPGSEASSIGKDAEEFEATEYNANIETRQLKKACGEIAALKSRDDVVFENANEYKQNCSYNFKVKKSSTKEILAVIQSFDPKEIGENTFTIKRQIDDFTSEEEILKKKLASIEETLTSAANAYDAISKLATKTQDVESLAKIIDSKIGIIERMTQERINTNAQLDRLGRSKTEQLDRLEYAYFNVFISENKFIDGDNLKDSWKLAVKTFIRDINSVVQDMTINLAALLFLALQYIIYFFIILIIIKYAWHFAKYIWLKQ
jgi:hypothetical protein